MQKAASTRFFLLFALLFVNFNLSKGSPVLDCDPKEPCTSDPYYEERKQELADEIDDVNDYMQMVADELTNNGVVVVRAVRTRITFPDMGDVMKPEILSLGAGDSGCEEPEDVESVEIISPDAKADVESQNLLSKDTTMSSEVKKSSLNIKNLETKSLETEIST